MRDSEPMIIHMIKDHAWPLNGLVAVTDMLYETHDAYHRGTATCGHREGYEPVEHSHEEDETWTRLQDS